MTLILGMKPGQHEYKVMGLAPYGTDYHGRSSLEVFRTINRVAGTEILNESVLGPWLRMTELNGDDLRDRRETVMSARHFTEVDCVWLQVSSSQILSAISSASARSMSEVR